MKHQGSAVELAVFYCCRYISIFLPVITAYCALQGGLWTLTGFIIAYGIMQLFELILMGTPEGHKTKPGDVNLLHTVSILGLKQEGQMWLYAIMQVLSIPIILYAFFIHDYVWWEILGIAILYGLSGGVTFMLVAHEFGHRRSAFFRTLSTFMFSLIYSSHFMINHVGHHKYTGMKRDTSTARRGEDIYRFWLRAIVGSYFNSFSMERERLQARGINPWSLQNRMYLDTVLKVVIPLLIVSIFNWQTFWFFLLISLVANMFGECTNYFSHFGLQRKMIDGKPVRSMEGLSWDADCKMSGWFFYGAGYHSKHHEKPTLAGEHLSPTEGRLVLNYSFPWLLFICLIPPLWFKIIKPHLPPLMKSDVDEQTTEHYFAKSA